MPRATKPPSSSPSAAAEPHSTRKQITFIHPDLGIGGAERLILDAALALQARGHGVTIYTAHRDTSHCFDEARDGTLDVRVHGSLGGVVPHHWRGRGTVLFAVLRQIFLMGWVVMEGGERRRRRKGRRRSRTGSEKEKVVVEEEADEAFIVDQVAACVPILRALRALRALRGLTRAHASRVLFYCHFPDLLLARRDEGGWLRRLLKAAYRVPFDAAEGWAVGLADTVVANSRFTKGVVGRVFGWERPGRGHGDGGGRDVKVVYPCVDTDAETADEGNDVGGSSGDGPPVLWGGMKVVLSINRFERKKNIELAVRAYHGLRERERQGTRLVIAGGYDHRIAENARCHRDLDSLATSLGLQTATSKTVVSALSIPDSVDVLFLLSVPSAFKQTLLRAASLLLYTPSHEHFGIVPVEAMHAGLPVLAVNNGGPLETIVEGSTGWLSDADAVDDWSSVMRKVLCELDADSLAEMGRNGRERVEREFSRRVMGERLGEEIDEMFTAEPKTLVSPSSAAVFSFATVVGLAVAILVVLLLRGGLSV